MAVIERGLDLRSEGGVPTQISAIKEDFDPTTKIILKSVAQDAMEGRHPFGLLSTGNDLLIVLTRVA
jgi:hypothetical protein